jgi:calcineurin-like phosphoesterase family protein
MEYHFTADLHLSHANIIKHCKRPWPIIEEHNENLISRWNSVVSNRDHVYVLGDFAMIPKQQDGTPRMKIYKRLRHRLKGKIHLILGNHDEMSQDVYSAFTEVTPYKELKIDKQKITLMHYPMRSWNGAFHGSGHLFGHVHGRLESEDTGVSFDVGVDVPAWNYMPVNWETVRKKLAEKRYIFNSRNKT